jgi:hypothetical protein
MSTPCPTWPYSHCSGGTELHRLCLALPIEVGARDPEVQHLDPSVTGDEQVRRLDVAVDHPEGLVCPRPGGGPSGVQRAGGGGHDLKGGPRRDWPVAEQLRGVYPLHVLHHHRGPTVDGGEVKDLDDIVVVQSGEQAGFVALARGEVGGVVHLGAQHLDGEALDEAVWVVDLGEVDGAEASATEGLEEAKPPLPATAVRPLPAGSEEDVRWVDAHGPSPWIVRRA